MNTWIVVYCVIGILWALFTFTATSYQLAAEGEDKPLLMMTVGVCFCLIVGTLWAITIPFSIAGVIGKKLAEESEEDK